MSPGLQLLSAQINAFFNFRLCNQPKINFGYQIRPRMQRTFKRQKYTVVNFVTGNCIGIGVKTEKSRKKFSRAGEHCSCEGVMRNQDGKMS